MSSLDVAAELRNHSPSSAVLSASAITYAMMNFSCSARASNSSCCGKSSSAPPPPWKAKTIGSIVPASELGTVSRKYLSTPCAGIVVIDCETGSEGIKHGFSTSINSSAWIFFSSMASSTHPVRGKVSKTMTIRYTIVDLAILLPIQKLLLILLHSSSQTRGPRAFPL